MKNIQFFISIFVALFLYTTKATSQELPDSAMYYDWNDSTDTWDKAYIEEYRYDSGQLIEVLTRRWKDQSWVASTNVSYTYDTNNNLILKLTKQWNGANWENFLQERHNFNSHGIRVLYSLADWTSGQWRIIIGNSLSYSYDSNERVTDKVVLKYITDWQQTEKYVYEYDTNNVATSAYYFTWNIISWDSAGRYLDYKWQISFDPSIENYPTDYIYQQFLTGNYINSERFSSVVDSGLIQSDYTEIWDTYNGQWENDKRTFYAYHPDGRKKEIIKQFFYDFTSQWVNLTRETNLYDSKNNPYLEKLEEDIGGLWVMIDGGRHNNVYNIHDRIATQMNETYYSGSWLRFDSINYFYQPSSIKELNSKLLGMKIYPNPAEDFIKLKFGFPVDPYHLEVSIFDILGNKVLCLQSEQKGDLNHEINLSELSSGIYLVNVKIDNSQTTLKLLKN